MRCYSIMRRRDGQVLRSSWAVTEVGQSDRSRGGNGAWLVELGATPGGAVRSNDEQARECGATRSCVSRIVRWWVRGGRARGGPRTNGAVTGEVAGTTEGAWSMSTSWNGCWSPRRGRGAV